MNPNDKLLDGSFFFTYYIVLKSYKYFYIYFRAPSGKVLTALIKENIKATRQRPS